MSADNPALRLLAVVLSVLLLGMSASVALAIAEDYTSQRVVPENTWLFDGTPISGLTREQASQAIAQRMGPAGRPITIHSPKGAYRASLTDVVNTDIEAMLDAAWDPTLSKTLAERLLVGATGDHPANTILPVLEVDEARLEGDVRRAAARIDTPPVNAAIFIENGKIVKRNAESGLEVDVAESVENISRILLTGVKRAPLVVDTVTPKIEDSDLGDTIVVRLSERRLYLYDGMELEETYRVAIGAPGHSTPRGTWEITRKRHMPTWRNPGSEWAREMPAVIPPGANNPLGTRALDLSANLIRIHGTTKNYSIGTAASRGCLRMHRWDVEDLFERVEVGTPVLIVR
ncbi:MAG: L,D-transpeptidase family protein [Actinobacteria bacterium]|nr:L,D-transpeptidase family protein [Actinomycetota bacterium]